MQIFQMVVASMLVVASILAKFRQNDNGTAIYFLLYAILLILI